MHSARENRYYCLKAGGREGPPVGRWVSAWVGGWALFTGNRCAERCVLCLPRWRTAGSHSFRLEGLVSPCRRFPRKDLVKPGMETTCEKWCCFFIGRVPCDGTFVFVWRCYQDCEITAVSRILCCAARFWIVITFLFHFFQPCAYVHAHVRTVWRVASAGGYLWVFEPLTVQRGVLKRSFGRRDVFFCQLQSTRTRTTHTEHVHSDDGLLVGVNELSRNVPQGSATGGTSRSGIGNQRVPYRFPPRAWSKRAAAGSRENDIYNNIYIYRIVLYHGMSKHFKAWLGTVKALLHAEKTKRLTSQYRTF